ncbi:hypothetical protein B0H13DRAFT_2656437 [Mycena leptocephala]|nr:hypothetical protein B0H13DRAFT_2656437 [Mycena leptocephala]
MDELYSEAPTTEVPWAAHPHPRPRMPHEHRGQGGTRLVLQSCSPHTPLCRTMEKHKKHRATQLPSRSHGGLKLDDITQTWRPVPRTSPHTTPLPAASRTKETEKHAPTHLFKHHTLALVLSSSLTSCSAVACPAPSPSPSPSAHLRLHILPFFFLALILRARNRRTKPSADRPGDPTTAAHSRGEITGAREARAGHPLARLVHPAYIAVLHNGYVAPLSKTRRVGLLPPKTHTLRRAAGNHLKWPQGRAAMVRFEPDDIDAASNSSTTRRKSLSIPSILALPLQLHPPHVPAHHTSPPPLRQKKQPWPPLLPLTARSRLPLPRSSSSSLSPSISLCPSPPVRT